jgi:phosphatidylglycerophosphate synthase
MLDRRAQALIAPGLRRAAAGLQRRGVSADQVTLAGFALGLAAAAAIALAQPLAGLALLLASRLADGLDGALARLTRPTDRGAFLDIALDFMFYASIPLAFALADPAANALAAAVLLCSFVGTGSSFLAFAVMAERRGLHNLALPDKGLYYLGGLTEATETLICFALMCLWPAAFAPLAYGFALLCGLTWLSRLHAGWAVLAPPPAAPPRQGATAPGDPP